ncbi:MAG: hypothetical protein LCH61_05415 [Proteobacteria bacterium]|nr:hypothetical protein [Pseudomonadota bacterium]
MAGDIRFSEPSQGISCQPSLNDRVSELLRTIQYRRASSNDELDEIRYLRYRCYLHEGIIKKNKANMLADCFDNKNNTHNISIHIEGQIVAAIRVHVLNASQPFSPSMSTFNDVLMPYIREGKTLIDPTRFVVDAAASRKHPELLYATLRVPFFASEYFKSEITLASVRNEHMPFYRRTLRYVPACEPRTYLQLTKPLGLMLVNFPLEKASVIRRFPFFEPNDAQMKMFFDVN